MAQFVTAGSGLVGGIGTDRRSLFISVRTRDTVVAHALFSMFLAGNLVASLFGTSSSHADMPLARSPSVSTPSATELVSTSTPVWHNNFESGWAAAKDSGRPMIIFITSEHCRFCDAMKQNTLCDASIRSRLAEGFVPIILRPDKNAKVLARIPVTTYPTTLLAHPRGKVIAHRVGYQPPDRFHELLGMAPRSPN